MLSADCSKVTACFQPIAQGHSMLSANCSRSQHAFSRLLKVKHAFSQIHPGHSNPSQMQIEGADASQVRCKSNAPMKSKSDANRRRRCKPKSEANRRRQYKPNPMQIKGAISSQVRCKSNAPMQSKSDANRKRRCKPNQMQIEGNMANQVRCKSKALIRTQSTQKRTRQTRDLR